MLHGYAFYSSEKYCMILHHTVQVCGDQHKLGHELSGDIQFRLIFGTNATLSLLEPQAHNSAKSLCSNRATRGLWNQLHWTNTENGSTLYSTVQYLLKNFGVQQTGDRKRGSSSNYSNTVQYSTY